MTIFAVKEILKSELHSKTLLVGEPRNAEVSPNDDSYRCRSGQARSVSPAFRSAQRPPSPSTSGPVAIPSKVDNFQLTDQTRLAHELSYFKAAPAIVVMSQVNGSKLSAEAAGELQKLAAAYKAKGVLFYMMNSNLGRDTRRRARGSRQGKIPAFRS